MTCGIYKLYHPRYENNKFLDDIGIPNTTLIESVLERLKDPPPIRRSKLFINRIKYIARERFWKMCWNLGVKTRTVKNPRFTYKYWDQH